MNYGESGGLSASDVALLTGNRNTGGFGGDGDNAWWIILFLIFGWGRNGFGGGMGNGIGENYVLATDFATIERKLDGVNSGLCDGFYAMNTGMLNGFAGVQQAMCQGFSGINTAINTSGYETRNAITDVGYALKDCCCQTQRAIDGVNYNMAQNTCAITTNATMNTRDIIEAVNANYRSLHDEIVANRLEDKNERIAELQAQVSGLQLRASQEAQNNYLISALGPKCPVPSYLVCNPNAPLNYSITPNGCGCGNF